VNKKLILGVMILAIVVLAPSIWACTESQTPEAPIPSPPITPVMPGYIWGYDHQLSYEFEYPEDWGMQVPQFESPYEKVEVFTKKGEPTQIKILVKSTNLMSLAEVKAFGYVSQESILKEKCIDINGRKAYEVIFKQYPDKKAKWVIFLTNDKEYTMQCYTTEDLYDAYEEIFTTS